MASRVSSPRATSPKTGFSVLGQVRTVSRDEIRQEAVQDPFLEVYRSEKRPLSPDSITHSPSKEQTFIAISKFGGPDGHQDIRSLGSSLSSLQERVENQAKELEAQAAILEEQSREIKELQPMKEWFQRQNMELYWSRVGSPRGVAAFEILKEVHCMLTEFMHSHLRSVIEEMENSDNEDHGDDDDNSSRHARRAQANAYRQAFSRGPFKSKKFRQGTYEDLLMHVAAKEEAGEEVEEAYADALTAAEEGFLEEATSAGFDMHDVGYVRSKMSKFLTDQRRKRNEACHPLVLKRSKKLKEEILEDIERACDSQNLGDLNEITPFIKFGCLLFRRHNHLNYHEDSGCSQAANQLQSSAY